jgi:arsenate reductase
MQKVAEQTIQIKSLRDQGMAEVGDRTSRAVIQEHRGPFRTEFDFVVTMSSEDEEICPFYPGKVHIHHGFDDPSRVRGTDEEIMIGIRKIRDEIMEWIEAEFGK